MVNDQPVSEQFSGGEKDARHPTTARLTVVPSPEQLGEFWTNVSALLESRSKALTILLRAELPSYRQLPLAEHVRTVQELYRIMIAGLSTGKQPSSEVLAYIRASARRRAYYGMPVYDVLSAFHFAQRSMWQSFRESEYADEHTLVELVDPMSSWALQMSQAVVDAYVDMSGGRAERERELREQLFAILRGSSDSIALTEILRELAYDDEGDFRVLAGRRSDWSRDASEGFQRGIRKLNGVVHFGVAGDNFLVLSQGVAAEDLVAQIQATAGVHRPLGVGLQRLGIDGLHESLADAVATLRVAVVHGNEPMWFDASWFEALLSGMTRQLDPLLKTGRRVASEHEDLADAVRAYAENGYSLASVGKQLHIHPNTVAYRLNRWKELTDLDWRVFNDLALSVLAIKSGEGKMNQKIREDQP